MNALEPQQKRFKFLAINAEMMWTLGRRFAIDLLVSAADQLNDGVVPTLPSRRCKHRRGSISTCVVACDRDFLNFLTFQPGAVDVGAKRIMPVFHSARGFVVRLLESLRLMVGYSIRGR